VINKCFIFIRYAHIAPDLSQLTGSGAGKFPIRGEDGPGLLS
jgi:hypothetical protein